jgi:glucose/mannose transport system substrate-binding protein
MTKALNDYAEILKYTTVEAASTDWQGAAKAVVDGKAAFNIMGDWAYGYFIGGAPNGLGKKLDTDFKYAPTPGTDGTYLWLSDSFTLPKGAPHAAEAKKWLVFLGSEKAQDTFNPVKGSIPARQDAKTSLYGPYLRWALKQWKTDKLAGSLTHGVVADNAWNADIDTAIGLFTQTHDVQTFQKALVTAHDKNA